MSMERAEQPRGGTGRANESLDSSRPTLRTIADLTGVHPSTVSRILRGETLRASEQTKRHVRRVADELGYRPDHAARALRTQRSLILGFLLPDLRDPVFAHIYAGADAAAARRGYHVLISPAGESPHNEERLRLLVDRGIDGVLDATGLYGHNWGGPTRLLPYVQLNRQAQGESPYVVGDDRRGGQIATEHLVDLGHANIAFVGGHPDASTTKCRLSGYRTAIAAAGLAIEPRYVITGRYDLATASEAAAYLLSCDPPPSAVFVADDTMAMALMRTMWEAGVRIPEDLSVVGYNDVPTAALSMPALTTVRNPLEEIGRLGAQTLLDSLDSSEGASVGGRTLPVTMVNRESTGPARRA